MSTYPTSWVWAPDGAIWPRFSALDTDNLALTGEGMAISPASLITPDAPPPPHSPALLSLPDESLSLRGITKTVQERARYAASKLTIAGQTHRLPLSVTLLADGSFAAELAPGDIPAHTRPDQVTQITLGRYDGTDYASLNASVLDAPFICFAAGTRIKTQNGFRRVEWISPGDMVYTADHGLQPVRWVAMRTVSGHDRGAPVHFAAGAFGNRRPVEVSQHHRFVTNHALAELGNGTSETLISAVHLINGSSIRLRPCNRVTYVHVMFDQHEIIYAENLPTESFHPSIAGLATLDGPTRAELHRVFPELAGDLSVYGPAARPSPRGYEAAATLVPLREQVQLPRGRRRLQ